MRSSPQLLSQQLEKKLSPLYLLYGTEVFLIEESANAIRQRIGREGEIERIVLHIDQAEQIASLYSQVEQASLFANTRLFEIKLGKLSQALDQGLTKLLEKPQDHTYFLIQTGSLNRQHQQAAWFNCVDRNGIVIPHWPLNTAQFATWVEQRAKQRGLSLSRESLLLLIYHTEGNCLAAAQEIENLHLADDSSPMHHSIFSQQSHFEVFDLCDAALAQQPARVVKIVSRLKDSGVALQLILWALAQTIRKTPSNAHRGALLSTLSRADLQSKSGQLTQAWRNTLEICLKLAGINFSLAL